MSDRRPTLHDRICKAQGCVQPIRAAGRAEGLCARHYQDRLKDLAAVGHLGDNHDRLRAAAQYLAKAAHIPHEPHDVDQDPLFDL